MSNSIRLSNLMASPPTWHPVQYDASKFLSELDERIAKMRNNPKMPRRFAVLCLVPLMSVYDVCRAVGREAFHNTFLPKEGTEEYEWVKENVFARHGCDCFVVGAEVPSAIFFTADRAW